MFSASYRAVFIARRVPCTPKRCELVTVLYRVTNSLRRRRRSIYLVLGPERNQLRENLGVSVQVDDKFRIICWLKKWLWCVITLRTDNGLRAMFQVNYRQNLALFCSKENLAVKVISAVPINQDKRTFEWKRIGKISSRSSVHGFSCGYYLFPHHSKSYIIVLARSFITQSFSRL